MTARRLTVIATGPSGPPEELDPLRAAGHEVVVGRPLDTPARRAYAEGDLIEQVRAADVLLASHRERVTPAVMEHAEHLGLVIVPFIGVDKIDVPAERAAAVGATLVELPALLAESDVVTVHAAGRRANLALALEQIMAVGRGETPAHVINPEAIPSWRMKP